MLLATGPGAVCPPERSAGCQVVRDPPAGAGAGLRVEEEVKA